VVLSLTLHTIPKTPTANQPFHLQVDYANELGYGAPGVPVTLKAITSGGTVLLGTFTTQAWGGIYEQFTLNAVGAVTFTAQTHPTTSYPTPAYAEVVVTFISEPTGCGECTPGNTKDFETCVYDDNTVIYHSICDEDGCWQDSGLSCSPPPPICTPGEVLTFVCPERYEKAGQYIVIKECVNNEWADPDPAPSCGSLVSGPPPGLPMGLVLMAAGGALIALGVMMK
jgi:hypothetical protein